MDNTKIYKHKGVFPLESGQQIENLQLTYHTFGKLNSDKSNVIWVFHALSGSSNVMEWWSGLFNDGCLFDPKEYYIVCVNSLGSSYGSTHPEDLSFPRFTIRDVVSTNQILAKVLNVDQIHTAIGASFGGDLALEFAYSFEGKIDHLILISSCSKESAWGIAIHESQRLAIQSDPSFGTASGGMSGMKAARSMAMLTYRSSDAFIANQTDEDEKTDNFRAASYMQYQGDKFVNRFSSLSYYYLTKCLDSHNIGRNRGGEVRALRQIKIPTLIIGVDTDTLIPVRLQRFMAENIPNSSFKEIHSTYGHDGFLVESKKITQTIKDFYFEQMSNIQSTKRRAILKFGGKSLSDDKALKNVVDIILKESKDKSIAIVVSARGVSTDFLTNLYTKALAGENYKKDLKTFFENQKTKLLSFDFTVEQESLSQLLEAVSIIGLPSRQLLDRVLSFGELISAKLLTAILNDNGMKAGFVDARNLIIGEYKESQVIVNNAESRERTLEYFNKIKHDFIPVITGFIASTESGETMALGRNGSNYSATLVACFINALEVQNWTDTDGIYSANPKYVANAVKLDHISYREANELANFGTSILHSKTILPLLYGDIPLRIKNSNTPDQSGTLIDKQGSNIGIKAVSVVEDVSLVSIDGKGLLGRVGIDSRIFSALSRHNISVRIISQASSERGVGFVIDTEFASTAEIVLIEEFQVELKADIISLIRVNNDMAIISIVGRHNFALEKAIHGLRKNRIWMHLMSNSISGEHISLVVDNKNLQKGVNVVHSHVLGVIKTLNVFSFGKGNVGGKLIDQVLATKEDIEKERNLRINIIGVADTTKYILNTAGVNNNWRSSLNKSKDNSDLNVILNALKLSGLENIVIVDNTASLELTHQYPAIVRKGFDIVASNKRANSIHYSFYSQLRSELKSRDKLFYYETNVGAGLPIIDTLKYLHHSSDNVTKVKGVFSGSLSYLFNNFSESDTSFYDVLEQARKQGFTEPDPREDLSGMDVARKLLILAREIGMTTELEEVEIESLIPEGFRQLKTYEEFASKKEDLNAHFDTIKKRLKPNEVLRYTGELDVNSNSLKVALVKADKNSPLGNIKNADSIFEIYTTGYGGQPMVIQGAGAGAEVTARGVYSDLLRVGLQV